MNGTTVLAEHKHKPDPPNCVQIGRSWVAVKGRGDSCDQVLLLTQKSSPLPSESSECVLRNSGKLRSPGVLGGFLVMKTTVMRVAQLDLRLFYGCSYRFHLSGDNSRDRYIKVSVKVS